MKNRSYLFLFGTLVIFFIVGYILLNDNKSKHELNITFLLESPLANYGDKLPDEISPFLKVFDSKSKELFFPKIVVKRLDVNNKPSEEINLTEKVSTSLSFNEIEKHFDKELPNEKASSLMILGSDNKPVDYNDTIGFLTFILVKNGSSVVDNTKYFDDAERLVKHVDNLLEDSYFEKNLNHKSNAIKIIIPKDGVLDEPKSKTSKKGNDNIIRNETFDSSDEIRRISHEINSNDVSESTVKKESNEQVVLKEPIKEKINIDLKLNENTNKLTWNSKIAEFVDNVIIELVLKIPGSPLFYSYDVSGLSYYIFDPNSSDFNGNLVDIEIKFENTNNKYQFYGNKKLSNKKLMCSAN